MAHLLSNERFLCSERILTFYYYLLSLQLGVVPCGGRKKSPVAAIYRLP